MRLGGNLLEDFGEDFSLIKEEATQERRSFGPIHFLVLGMLTCEIVTLGIATIYLAL